jgi:hypothetical protein
VELGSTSVCFYLAKIGAFAERCAWFVGFGESLKFMLGLEEFEVVFLYVRLDHGARAED